MTHWNHLMVIKQASSNHIEYPNNSNTKRWFAGVYLIVVYLLTNHFLGIFHVSPYKGYDIWVCLQHRGRRPKLMVTFMGKIWQNDDRPWDLGVQTLRQTYIGRWNNRSLRKSGRIWMYKSEDVKIMKGFELEIKQVCRVQNEPQEFVRYFRPWSSIKISKGDFVWPFFDGSIELRWIHSLPNHLLVVAGTRSSFLWYRPGRDETQVSGLSYQLRKEIEEIQSVCKEIPSILGIAMLRMLRCCRLPWTLPIQSLKFSIYCR